MNGANGRAARPDRCQVCDRTLVTSTHRGAVPPGTARYAGNGVCTACKERGGTPPSPSPRPLLAAPPAWADDAACAAVGFGLADAWFPDKGESTRQAKDVCAECPVRAECLTWALENNERFGVWGGLSERERRRLQGGTDDHDTADDLTEEAS